MASGLPAPAGVFTRASSGLVRQVGTRDVFAYGWQVITVPYVVFMVLAWGAYPGASMELATVLATVGGVAVTWCYGMAAQLYPRSGADYVFLSRTLHPAVGFTLSFSYTFWVVFYVGVNSAFFALYAVSPLLAALGVQAHSPAMLHAASWCSGPAGVFVIGTGVVLTIGYLQYRGAGGYFRWQRWATYLSLASLAVTLVVLALAAAGVLDFTAHFDRLAGVGSYHTVVTQGVAAGAAPAAPFSLAQTARFLLWPAFTVWFAAQAITFSGEVKDVRRGQLVGMVGAVVVAGIALIALTWLSRVAFGADFLLSAAANGIPLDVPPQITVFTAIAGGNVLLTLVMSIWVPAILLFVTGTGMLYSTRSMLAWSLDGMAPRWLGEVNDRYHSPHRAILVCMVAGEGCLALYAFTKLLGPIAGFLGFIVNFFVMGVCCAILPFVRRRTFEGSPIAWRIGAVPVVTILGVIAAVFTAPIIYLLTRDTTFSPNLTFVVWGAVTVIAAGLAWYLGWRAHQKQRGVDIARRYAQIPVE